MRAMSVQVEKVTPFERIYDVLFSVAEVFGYDVKIQSTGSVQMNFQDGELCLSYPNAATALLDWYDVMQLQQKEYGWWASELSFIETYLFPRSH